MRLESNGIEGKLVGVHAHQFATAPPILDPALASSCNCTSYAGIVSLIYSNTPPPLLPILSFLNIA